MTTATNALTAMQVTKAKLEPGRYGDGNGLYLVVDDGGNKRWELRLVQAVADHEGQRVKGKRREVGLGNATLLSLAEARALAVDARKVAMRGEDVAAFIRSRRGPAPAAKLLPSFEMIAREVHTAYKPTWKNAKAATQWLTSLETYAFPVFGSKQVKDVEQADVLKALSPIWTTKIETAYRLKQRMALVFDWAKTHGHRTGDNPCSGVEHGLPSQPKKVAHHGALAIDAMPGFMAKLRTHDAADLVTRLSTEWLILTATRQNETRGADWAEIDASAKTWTIPAERMKAEVEHVVPLTDRSMTILDEIAAMSGGKRDGLIFSIGGRKALSENTHANLVKAVSGDDNATAHGMRSTFRDWASERTSFPSDVAEMALAHTIKNKVEAAYRRGNLLEKRRELMAAWQTFIGGDHGNVVRLPSKASA